MNNDEVQPDVKRKSRINMGIQRLVQTKQFENIVIHYTIDEEISWKDPAERSQKLRNWETVMTQEYKGMYDRVLKELDLAHKCAYFKDSQPAKKSVQSLNLDDLDDLDSIDDLDSVG